MKNNYKEFVGLDLDNYRKKLDFDKCATINKLEETFEKAMTLFDQTHKKNITILQNAHENEIKVVNNNFDNERENIEKQFGKFQDVHASQYKSYIDLVKNLQQKHEHKIKEINEKYNNLREEINHQYAQKCVQNQDDYYEFQDKINLETKEKDCNVGINILSNNNSTSTNNTISISKKTNNDELTLSSAITEHLTKCGKVNNKGQTEFHIKEGGSFCARINSNSIEINTSSRHQHTVKVTNNLCVTGATACDTIKVNGFCLTLEKAKTVDLKQHIR